MNVKAEPSESEKREVSDAKKQKEIKHILLENREEQKLQFKHSLNSRIKRTFSKPH